MTYFKARIHNGHLHAGTGWPLVQGGAHAKIFSYFTTGTRIS